MSKFSRWTFTNFDLDFDYTKLINQCSYLIVGKETCPNTGTVHHQCYIEFASKRVFNGIKKLIPKAHIESAKGGPDANKKYCSKDDCVLIEFGKMFQQGSRTDLKKVKEMIKAGASLDDVIDTDANYQCLRASELILKYKEPRRDWKPKVFWYWGPSGTGKSETAFAEAGASKWVSAKSLKWWEGYDAHENVVIDDFRAYFCEFAELLRILDKYEYRIEVKGGSRQLRARNIWITCPDKPEDVYVGIKENMRQLLRRIDVVKYFGPEVLDQKSRR